MDTTSLSVIADLLINMAAGWFSLVFIVPAIKKIKKKIQWTILIGNLLYGTLCLIGAYILRRLI